MDDVLAHDSEDDDDDGAHLDPDDETTNLELAANDSHAASSTAGRSNNLPIMVEAPQIPFDLLGPRLRRGNGRHFPTKYTFRNDHGKVLIRTDGACLNNGQPNPKAGWAFWHGLDHLGKRLIASGHLEKKGPFGDDSIQSSNRAELRAVIAALRFRHWPGEGFHTFVIATDSEYAVEGSTKWAKTWIENGWTTRGRADVKNRDLWEVLLGEIEGYKDYGMAVQFWKIPRDWNIVADAAAKDAAAEVDAPDEWREVFGINC
ncbi:RNase H domain-containing protein [Hirsutella rhossiliensis]